MTPGSALSLLKIKVFLLLVIVASVVRLRSLQMDGVDRFIVQSALDDPVKAAVKRLNGQWFMVLLI